MCDNTTQKCKECMVKTRNLPSRRCFMTGGYCSKLNLIQEKREQLHQDNTINAFVVMNFSAISDLQYKRKIRLFIESLKKYLYLSGETIRCCDGAPANQTSNTENGWRAVEKINPIRSDATYASNFVMCSRVCQQIMIADLIIVDVSVENANVFYELGMAIALGKLILPICSHESYFSRNYPTEKEKAKFSEMYKEISPDKFRSICSSTIKKIDEDKKVMSLTEVTSAIGATYNRIALERHLGYFPWRKQLFEHYGIRFRNTELSKQFDVSESNPELTDWILQDQITRYIDFRYVREPLLGLSDQYLTTFPYSDYVPDPHNPQNRKRIGELIYEKLQKSYNFAGYQDNTVVIYITDGFLNEKQAGRCMVNYYNNFTKRMQESGCFCGDRVGILVQESKIPERRKDSRVKESILYDTGEIFLIAVNEATYLAQHKKIGWVKKSESSYSKDAHSKGNGGINNSDESSEKYFLKDYLCNKGMIILPEKPVYVKRLVDKLQPEISLDLYQAESNNASENDHFYCLFHIMLENLKYTNQVVVDITDNSLTSLFWLGAANGANIPSIFVKWDRSDDERKELVDELLRRGVKNVDYITNPSRRLFDISGLWTASLRTNDIDGFYRQIALAQMDIEQQSKLTLQFLDESSTERKQLTMMRLTESEYNHLLVKQENAEKEQLEAFYREQFWKAMLCNNKIYFFLEGHSGVVQKSNSEERIQRNHVVERDVESISILSQYLSKHSITGEFEIKSLGTDVLSEAADNLCFISIGSGVKPFRGGQNHPVQSLVDHISTTVPADSPVLKIIEDQEEDNPVTASPVIEKEFECRGFVWEENGYSLSIFTTLPSPNCFTPNASSSKCQDCPQNRKIESKPIIAMKGTPGNRMSCCTPYVGGTNEHIQLAQIVFWREKKRNGTYVYQVALNGVSGPATKALSVLLVGYEGSKEKIFKTKGKQNNGNDSDVNRFMLSQLQEEICANFIKDVDEKLQSNTSKSAEKAHTLLEALTEQAVNYLNHVLYQYFLPFLSVDDEKQLKNGMCYYLRSYAVANMEGAEGSRDEINAKIDDIGKQLKNALESLCGVQALCQVRVCVNASDIDSRSIQNIQLINTNEIQYLDQESITSSILATPQPPEHSLLVKFIKRNPASKA